MNKITNLENSYYSSISESSETSNKKKQKYYYLYKVGGKYLLKKKGKENVKKKSSTKIRNEKVNIKLIESHINSLFRYKYTKLRPYNTIIINRLIYNANSSIVTSFKENLILCDYNEYFFRFYGIKKGMQLLKKILDYYETNNIIYPNYNNNSFCGDIEKNNFLIQNPQFHNNSFINNNIINNNNNGKNKKRKTNQNISINITNNKKNNLFNANAELEMLLIQVKKILIKIQKIDTSVYSKCKGNFEQIIRTHKGSRIFQNYLKNTHYDILHLIFSEIKNKLTELLKDNYSNYFCKKLFRNLSQKDRIEYLTLIQPELNALSKDSIATYPIQNIIEELGSKNEKNIFYLGIKNYIDNFAYNIYGARILEKILAYFEDEFKKEIIEYICENFLELAYNNNGICLVKKILLMTHKKELHIKLKKLVFDNALNLIVHQYGNYAIQIIIENWDETDLKEILEIYENKYIFLSNQKFSSNVMERILEKSEKNLENYINEISKGYNLNELLKNKYGNFVIKKAYDLANGNLKKKLGESINENLKLLDNTKIVNKWKGKLIQNNSI